MGSLDRTGGFWMNVRFAVFVTAFLLSLVGVVVPGMEPASAAGATITVNTPDDVAAADGHCSLREALQAADTNHAVDTCHTGSSSGSDTIQFATAINGQTITLQPGGLEVDSNVIIKGNGRSKTVIAGDEFFNSNGTSTYEHITLVDVNNEAATAHVIDVKATREMNNNSGSGEKSVMHISNSTFPGVTNNSSDDNTAVSTLTITKSIVTDVIDNNSFTGSISHLTVTNSKTREIDNNSGGSTTTGSIKNTTVSIFTPAGDGVSVSGGAGTTVDTDGKTKIVNSSIVGNIEKNVEVNGGTTTVLNSTLTKSDLGVDRSAGSIKLTNSIVALNSSPNCTGAVGSGGGNISDDGSCHFSKPHDHNNKNPKLGTLANHGGRTQTQLPQQGSPAIDGGLNGPCPAIDQRGKKRPQDGNHDGTKVCDVGAVEIVP
jgi:CSLREA domain-containing protein